MVDIIPQYGYDTTRFYPNPVYGHPSYTITHITEADCHIHTQLQITNDDWTVKQTTEMSRICIEYYTTHLNTDQRRTLYDGTLALPVLHLVMSKSVLCTTDKQRQKLLASAQDHNDTLMDIIHREHSHKPDTPPTLMFDDCSTALAVNAIVRSQQGSYTGSSIQRLVDWHEHALKNPVDTLIKGKAGYCHLMWYLLTNGRLKQCCDKDSEYQVRQAVNKVLDAIFESGRATAKKMNVDSPLAYEHSGHAELSWAVGLAGVLLVMLHCDWWLDGKDKIDVVRQSIAFCMTQLHLSGNFKRYVGATTDELVQVCIGAPSLALLCIHAYRHFNDKKYLQYAIQQSDVVWTRGLLKKGVGLCHGISGTAAVFIHLYQLTGNKVFLRRAEYFMEFAVNSKQKSELWQAGDAPFSFYNGLAGAVMVMCDLIGVRRGEDYTIISSDYGL